jgi:hypothetical protein
MARAYPHRASVTRRGRADHPRGWEHGGVSVRALSAEVAAALPGDDLVPDAQVVLDRAFDLPAPPAQVWPWFAQLGRGRAGWYLPRWAERAMPRGRRALRHLDESLQHLRPGDVIDDWGGRDATFEIVTTDPPHTLVHRSTRGALRISWTITLRPAAAGTRVQLRLRLAGIRRPWLAEYGGGFVDLVTVAGLAAGLRERVREPQGRSGFRRAPGPR